MSSFRLPVLALASLIAFPCLALAGPFDATRTTLRNGMQVVLSPDSLATTVDVALWFPAGSRHERAGQQGLALLAAQAAFRNAATDVLAPLEAVGGTGGLVTTADYTSFSATVPADAFAGALAFLAERAPGRTTTATDLATERAAIRDERARAERTPVQRALARLWAATWPGHAYARIGALPDAGSDKLTPADVDAWRRTRLAPSAAVLTVSGAFDPTAALAAVRERFESRPRVTVSAVAPVAPRAPQRATERMDVPVRLCLVGWRAPGVGDADAAALELLAAWLGGSPRARLGRALVEDWKLAVTAQAGLVSQQEGSLLWTLAVVAPDADSSAVESTLLDAVAGVARTAPEAFEVERARRQVESALGFASQTSRQRGQAIGEGERLVGADAAARRLAALRAVTGADLQRVAARVLVPASRATLWVMPASDGGAR